MDNFDFLLNRRASKRRKYNRMRINEVKKHLYETSLDHTLVNNLSKPHIVQKHVEEVVDYKNEKIYSVQYHKRQMDNWSYKTSSPYHKNPLGANERAVRKERDWLRNLKTDYEMTGELKYEKAHPSFENLVKKVQKLKGDKDTRFGQPRRIKRLPHLMDGITLERINWNLNWNFLRMRRRRPPKPHGEFIQTKYRIVATDDFGN